MKKRKYQEIVLVNNGEKEMKEKITTRNKIFYANKKLLKNNLPNTKVKITIYETIIRSTMIYAAET